jgi:phosphoadenylyl-sulfate reductase (thioredoxin)
LAIVKMRGDENNTLAGPARLGQLAREVEPWPPQRLLEWAVGRWGDRLALCTSFQIGGMVLIDMAVRTDLPLRVLTIDTGRLPEQAHELIHRVRCRYGLEVEVLMPDPAQVGAMVRRSGPNLFYDSVDARLECCRLRKGEPLRRALAELDAWMTGARREQTAARATMEKLALDPIHEGAVKLAPLADWSAEAVWSYARAHNVLHHPLYERGYKSIGCAPCTRAVAAHESTRAGRWWWEGGRPKECGLHAPTPSRLDRREASR